MPLEKKIQLSKSNCLESIYFVLRTLSSKSISRIQFKILQKLLGTAISCLTKLAFISGVSLTVFIGSELSATPQQMKSSIPFDYDRDGDYDIIDADSSTGNLFLLRNSGLNFKKELLINPPLSADLVGATDIDSDGDKDLVLLDKSTGELQILKNQGSDNFVPQAPTSLNSVVKEAFLSDMNQDGSPDLAYSTPNAMGWAKNNGSEGFLPQASVASGLTDVTALEIEDFDNDGDNDFHYSDSTIPGIGVANNKGSENFVPQQLGSGNLGISDIEIADIDADGRDDVVYASNGSSVIGWMKNNGSDNFLPAETLASGITSVDQIEVADLDNDQDLDIVGASSESNYRAWLENDGSDNFIPHQLG